MLKLKAARYCFPVLMIIICMIPLLNCSNDSSGSLPKLVSVDLAAIDPEQFSKDEWFMPYYLKHFSTLANSVQDTGANRGFIDIKVWRNPNDNEPYNARIMENILSLVWFYVSDRPWNPYYKDKALKKRIEAALTFWCNSQNSDGRFSEYGPNRWSLAPTAFAAKFIGKSIYLLEKGPSINREILNRTKEAMRKVLYITFTDSALWQHGRNYTNQYENIWGGALMYLEHNPDTVIERLMVDRLKQSMDEFQSPCGYFYERNGPDWGYNLGTHHSDMQVAWHFVRDTELEEYFAKKAADWYDWFSYNAVLEPNTSRYFVNKAVETRQQLWYIDTDSLEDPSSYMWFSIAEEVPVARAFVLSQEEYEAEKERYYQQMISAFPKVMDLKMGEFWSYSPYAFLHNDLYLWLPTEEQKKAAIAKLPYLANESFVQVRKDERNSSAHSFIRTPDYYAIFNSGKIITDQQRYGLGLIWNPLMGTVFQSQSRSDAAAWGTRAGTSKKVYEASDLIAEFLVGGQEWNGKEGTNNIQSQIILSYALGTAGKKSVEFGKKAIKVTVQHSGEFTEVIPLLIGEGDRLDISGNIIHLESKNADMAITASNSSISILPGNIFVRGGKTCRIAEIKGRGKLTYEISFRQKGI